MLNIDDLKSGLLFKANDGMTWEVDKLVEVATTIPHVKIVGINDRYTNKIIAASVLLDQRRFQAV
jgi:hypothetical protein